MFLLFHRLPSANRSASANCRASQRLQPRTRLAAVHAACSLNDHLFSGKESFHRTITQVHYLDSQLRRLLCLDKLLDSSFILPRDDFARIPIHNLCTLASAPISHPHAITNKQLYTRYRKHIPKVSSNSHRPASPFSAHHRHLPPHQPHSPSSPRPQTPVCCVADRSSAWLQLLRVYMLSCLSTRLMTKFRTVKVQQRL